LIYFKQNIKDHKIDVRYSIKNALRQRQSIDIQNIVNFPCLSDKEKEKIIENNALDIELYDFAIENILKKYRKNFQDNIDIQINHLQEANRNYKQRVFLHYNYKMFKLYLKLTGLENKINYRF
jgi:hypothetical protein